MTDEVPKIRKLDPTVVNRIAAGEVVQRPSSAIKEMIENSLDAGATSIVVTLKQGGLQMMQIQDNGHGIRKEDLDIVCERFTTSKLTTFDDLKKISTYGFRGEALASITHVAQVTIMTRTKDSPCAFKARYCDGKLIGASGVPNSKPELKPCAGVLGTTITVEDLFYNMPTRKQAFKNTNEEYQRVLDVITKYAIRFGDENIAFTCKKHGQMTPDLHTTNTSSTLDNIRIAYGPQVARELIDFHMEHRTSASSDASQQSFGELEFSIQGKISNANYSNKKPIYIFFINNRLVESNSIKKVIESVYQEVLPKHSHPFVYMSISMPSHHVDVNVHPTKREVHFLFEDLFLEKIYSKLSETLRNANDSRSFEVQRLIHPASSFLTALPPSPKKQSSAASDSTDINNTKPHILSQSEHLSQLESSVIQERMETEIDNYSQEEKEDPESRETADKDTVIFAKNSTNKPSSGSSYSFTSFSGGSGGGNGGHGVGNKRKSMDSFASTFSSSSKVPKAPSSSSGVAPNKFVRTDYTMQKINTFFRPSTSSTPSQSSSFSKEMSSSDNSKSEVEVAVNVEKNDTENMIDNSAILYCMTCVDSGNTKGPLNSVDFTTASQCGCCGVGMSAVVRSSPNTSTLPNTNTKAILLPLQISSCEYTSIRTLQQQIMQLKDTALEKVLKQHTFVGAVNSDYSLIQYQSKLLLVDHSTFLTHLFYQLVIFRFAEMDSLALNPCLSIYDFVSEELQAATEQNSTILFNPDIDGDMTEVTEKVCSILSDKSEMLSEYFNITIDVEGGCRLTSLPALIPIQGQSSNQYHPDLQWLGHFLILLALETNWEDELECFQQVAMHIANYYAKLPVDEDLSASSTTLPCLHSDAEMILEDLLYPAMKKYLCPSKSIPMATCLIELASLEQMYKIFERC